MILIIIILMFKTLNYIVKGKNHKLLSAIPIVFILNYKI